MKDEDEDVEGLDDESSRERGADYPLDDVMVRSETRTVGEVIKRVESGRYLMDPDFQRDFVWPADKQSKLIESCVMRIPLPVLYVAEGVDGRVTVVDGLQRLSTFRAFLNGSLKLKGLGEKNPLEGKVFKTLPITLQERVEDTQLTLYILDKNAPEAARLDIFERVNSGVPLTRQQMRNALYNGSGTRWLAKMANEDEFIEATGASLKPKTMRDREAINRFCAFHILGWEQYKSGDMDDYLAQVLNKMNRPSFDLDKLEKQLRISMSRNFALFGKQAFRKSLVNPRSARSVINIALFDVLSVGMAKVSEAAMQRNQKGIKESILHLMRDEDFEHCISYSTNSTYNVHGRFRGMNDALKEFFA